MSDESNPGKKALDCYLNGAKSPERRFTDSNIVGNLKRGGDVRSDAFKESAIPLNERKDRYR